MSEPILPQGDQSAKEKQQVQEDLSSRKNPYEEQLKQQGIPLEINDKHKNPNIPVSEGKHLTRDRLSGLVVEDDEIVRPLLAKKLTNAVKSGQKWAIVYADTDNLKLANTVHGREFGDNAINYGNAKVATALDNVQFGEGVEVILTRQEGAADEAIAYIFGLSDEEESKLRDEVSEAGKPTRSKDPEFTFSVTPAVISPRDERIADSIENTKAWLEQNPDKTAYKFFQEVKDLGDHDTKLSKIAKDMARMPIEELMKAEGMDQMINTIVTNLGDSRISTPLLKLMLRFTAIQGALRTNVSEDVKRKQWEEVGITEDRLKNLSTEDEREALFRDLFELPGE